MPKTTLVDGSIVTPLYLNTINGTDANTGHTHDGLNQDGSVPKIRLTNALDITGIAPSANVTHVQAGDAIFNTGGGNTIFSVDFFRVGNIGGFQLVPAELGTTLPPIVGGPLPITITTTGNWPSAFFGTSTKNSIGLVYAPVSVGAASWAANITYKGVSNAMDMEPISGSGYATNDEVNIQKGFTVCFMIAEGEF